MNRSDQAFTLALILPAGVFAMAFFMLPMTRLFLIGGSGEDGWQAYASLVTNPRHFEVMLATLALSLLVTVSCLAVATICGLFLVRQVFFGRQVLIALLSFPLAFPGVVVGFMIIILAGRQGLIGSITQAITGEKLVFAYSMAGLFVGYLYFSIPRVLLTVMAGIEKLDPSLPEAARSLGARPIQVFLDITLPALRPALIASGAIAFATAMGAFGTAFTLATDIDVLPMLIYTEFTLQANLAGAGALSIVLGLITWLALSLARYFSGGALAAAA